MPLFSRTAVLASLFFAALAFPCAHAADAKKNNTQQATEPNLEDAWSKAAMGLVMEARHAFSEAEGREARFGEAMTLLLSQPKTNANINRAAKLLNQIIEQNPNDTQGIIARYHLGRLEQAHRTPPDLEAAAGHYRQLFAAFPMHPLAEEGIVKLGIIELYSADLSDEARFALHRKYAERAATFKNSSARRDLHFLLAQVAQRYRFDKEITLEHYLAAEREGIIRSATRGDVYVSIIVLARDLKRTPVVRQYCERFLKEYLRDSRRYMIEEIRDNLPPESAATSENVATNSSESL